MVVQSLVQLVYFTQTVCVTKMKQEWTQSWSQKCLWFGLAAAHTHAVRLLLLMLITLRTFWIALQCVHHIYCASLLCLVHQKGIIRVRNGKLKVKIISVSLQCINKHIPQMQYNWICRVGVRVTFPSLQTHYRQTLTKVIPLRVQDSVIHWVQLKQTLLILCNFQTIEDIISVIFNGTLCCL